MIELENANLTSSRDNARHHLLQKRNEAGHWEGYLSGSALSTATAVMALSSYRESTGDDRAGLLQSLIDKGLDWLAENQNDNGGWGDTVKSKSNISTTVLAWSVFPQAGTEGDFSQSGTRAREWVRRAAGGIDIDSVCRAIAERYGEDRTFSAPILSMAALSGRFGENRAVWEKVAALPYELALLPRQWFGKLNLRVVSYALPALIAIGQARAVQAPSRNPIIRSLRRKARKPTMKLLEEIQPENGGFLEATPLTSFVVMNLLAAGYDRCAVIDRGVRFIINSVREDGSWPIDTNLATWVTTLTINQLRTGISDMLSPEERLGLVEWLLEQQYREVHPYTGAPPGGWAWTNLPGAVPDADDTAGALLALHTLSDSLTVADATRARIHAAAALGTDWLIGLQNRDGGVPTFCRGWQKLPFDRSGADLTGHALAAMNVWQDRLDPHRRERIRTFTAKALHYLYASQKVDGSWTPLWFGNQHDKQEENPVYGSCRVIAALQEIDGTGESTVVVMLKRATEWLIAAQNPDGGWGGNRDVQPSSPEETGLSVCVLARQAHRQPDMPGLAAALEKGGNWLMHATEQGRVFASSPIGFYFARLWYYEELYPLIFVTGAMEELDRLYRVT